MITNLHIICQENEHKAIGLFFSRVACFRLYPYENITRAEYNTTRKRQKIPPDGGIFTALSVENKKQPWQTICRRKVYKKRGNGISEFMLRICRLRILLHRRNGEGHRHGQQVSAFCGKQFSDTCLLKNATTGPIIKAVTTVPMPTGPPKANPTAVQIRSVMTLHHYI